MSGLRPLRWLFEQNMQSSTTVDRCAIPHRSALSSLPPLAWGGAGDEGAIVLTAKGAEGAADDRHPKKPLRPLRLKSLWLCSLYTLGSALTPPAPFPTSRRARGAVGWRAQHCGSGTQERPSPTSIEGWTEIWSSTTDNRRVMPQS